MEQMVIFKVAQTCRSLSDIMDSNIENAQFAENILSEDKNSNIETDQINKNIKTSINK